MKKIILIVLLVIVVIIVVRMASRRRNMPDSAIPVQSPPMQGQPYRAGDYREVLQVDARERTYLLHVPAGFDPQKEYPLLLGFHGGNGSGEKFSSQTGFSMKADNEGFIAVFPDGIEHNWNDGRDTTDAFKQGADDIAFVRALVEDLKAKLPVNKSRIYATGVSNGGIFVHRLGCEMADIFAGIGSVVGPIASKVASRCVAVAAVSVVAIQGVADTGIPINGGETGRMFRGRKIGDGGLVESAAATRTLWASKNACLQGPQTESLPILENDGTHVEKITYTSCRDNTEVIYYLVHGMGHGWPPKEAEAPAVFGSTSHNINATDVIWNFFKTHSKI